MVDDPTDAEPAAPATSTPRKKVVSKRVTPKGGPAVRKTPTSTTSRSTKSDDDVSFSSGRYTPPSSKSAADLPSPWWVPTLMFGLLILGALVIIVMHVVEAYWAVLPYAPQHDFGPHWMDLACLLGVAGVYLAFVFRNLAQYPLLPVGDPRLARSLRFMNA